MYRNGLFINRLLHIREHEVMMTKSHKNNVDAAFLKKNIYIFQSYIISIMCLQILYTKYINVCSWLVQDLLIAYKCFAIEAVMYLIIIYQCTYFVYSWLVNDPLLIAYECVMNAGYYYQVLPEGSAMSRGGSGISHNSCFHQDSSLCSYLPAISDFWSYSLFSNSCSRPRVIASFVVGLLRKINIDIQTKCFLTF